LKSILDYGFIEISVFYDLCLIDLSFKLFSAVTILDNDFFDYFGSAFEDKVAIGSKQNYSE